MVFPVVIPTFVLIFRLRVLLLAAASSVLAASYLVFPTRHLRVRRNGLVCPLASLNALKWVVFLTPCNAGFVYKSPRVSGER